MTKRTAAAKKGDALLGIMALLVIGGLCFKGIQTLHTQQTESPDKQEQLQTA